MGHSRTIEPAVALDAVALTGALVGVGMNFVGHKTQDPNIEDTLLFASIEGMERDDLRLLSVLVTWFGVHSPWVNADRLTRLVEDHESPRVRALWSGLGTWRLKDRRFHRMVSAYQGPRLDLSSAGMEFFLARHGEDPRFAESALRVPANVLRDRARDVMEPAELAKRHRPYHWRVIMGPSYRADMWAALERDPSLTSAELARRTYGSFATAWHVKRDFALVHGDASKERSN